MHVLDEVNNDRIADVGGKVGIAQDDYGPSVFRAREAARNGRRRTAGSDRFADDGVGPARQSGCQPTEYLEDPTVSLDLPVSGPAATRDSGPRTALSRVTS